MSPPGTTSRRARAVVVAAGLVLVVVLTRLPGLTKPPTDFAGTRQFHSLTIAHERFVTLQGDDASDLDLLIARSNRAGTLKFEPPVLENLVAFTWDVTGGERVWVARLWSTVFFAASALVLFATARRMFGVVGAAVAAGAYVVMPLGYDVSRAVMPHAAMLCALSLALYFLAPGPHDERAWRAAAAGASTGVAGLLAPYVVFVPAGVWLAVTLQRARGMTRASLLGQSLFPMLSAAPVLAFYGFAERSGAEGSRYFLPALYRQVGYWRGWAGNVHRTTALVVLAAIAGTLLTRHAAVRAFLLGGAAGYAVFGLVFTWHISTHPYYQAPVLPLVALGAGAAADALRRGGLPRARAAVVAVLAGAALVVTGWLGRPGPDEALPERAAAIAEHLRPVGRAAVLAPDYARPLTYYGNFAGTWWPQERDLRFGRLTGAPSVAGDDRLSRLRPRWFVVTDVEQFARQPDLEAALRPYPAVAATTEYRIWDLGAAPWNNPRS